MQGWILIILAVCGPESESEERVNANSVLLSVIRAFEMPDKRSLRKPSRGLAVSWVRSLECSLLDPRRMQS